MEGGVYEEYVAAFCDGFGVFGEELMGGDDGAAETAHGCGEGAGDAWAYGVVGAEGVAPGED